MKPIAEQTTERWTVTTAERMATTAEQTMLQTTAAAVAQLSGVWQTQPW